MIKFLSKSFKKEPLPIKDPADWTLTKSSTSWCAQRYWCTVCKTNRGHYQYVASLCNNCGNHKSIEPYGCSIRQIWNGSKWVSQYKERYKEWVGE